MTLHTEPPNSGIEFLSPPDMIHKIIEQNKLILEMNKQLLEAWSKPPIVYSSTKEDKDDVRIN